MKSSSVQMTPLFSMDFSRQCFSKLNRLPLINSVLNLLHGCLQVIVFFLKGVYVKTQNLGTCTTCIFFICCLQQRFLQVSCNPKDIKAGQPPSLSLDLLSLPFYHYNSSFGYRVHYNSPYFPNYYISLHCYAQLSASISDTQALPLSPPHSDMPWQLTTKMVSESTVINPFLHNIIHYYKLSLQCQILSILLCPSLMLMLLEILK